MAYSPEQFKEDGEYIVQKLMDVHPCPDYRLGKEALEENIAFFLERVPRRKSLWDFHLQAQKFLVSIRDAHTFMAPVAEEKVACPLECDYIDGQVVVKDSMPDIAGVEPGDVILFIDGREAGLVLQEKLAITPYNVYDYGVHEALTALFHYPAGEKEKVKLTLVKRNHEPEEVEVPLYPVQDSPLSSWRTEKLGEEMLNTVSWDIIDGVWGYLRYRRCLDRSSPMLVQEGEKYGVSPERFPSMEEVCQELFTALQDSGQENLILDLRGNTGGDSTIAHALYKYITRETLRDYEVIVKVSSSAKEFMEKNRNIYGEHWQKLIDQFLAAPPGQMKMPQQIWEYPYDGSEKDTGLFFPGRVFVLTDGKTFSSGEYLAVILKDNGIGTFVGEPTGGGGTVPGDTLYFKTPHLKLTAVISYKMFQRPDPKAQKLPTVLPDYYIKPALQDLQDGRDTVLEWLKEFLT